MAISQTSAPSPPAGVPTKSRPSGGSRALLLVEEAYCLMRSAPLSTVAIFYFGAIPFVAAVFYFWADMSRSSFAAVDAAGAALGVALAYGWMKALQAWFCRRLWGQLQSEGDLPRFSPREMAATLVAHGLVQALALPLLALSVLLLVPLAWVYAFFHNATALALTREPSAPPLRSLVSRSAAMAHWRWGANHLVLGISALVAFLVWANLVMLAAVVPQLVKWVFGIESVFTLFPLASLANTTFLFASLLATFLVMGPLTQSIYVLRCFYAESRQTGSDLLSRLETLRRSRDLPSGPAAGRVAMLLAVSLGSNTAAGLAQDDPAGADLAEARVQALDTAIEQTLRGKSYQWRLARDPGALGRVEGDGEARGLAGAVESGFRRFGEGVKRLYARLFQGQGGADSAAAPAVGNDGGGLMAMVLSLLSLALIGGMLAWAVVQIRRRAGGAQAGDSNVASLTDADSIDLEQSDLVASQLPEDEWLRLAREQIAAGEYRLAVRALFLGSLAHLGGRDLIEVARHKSNRDYRIELELKARSLNDLRHAFAENVGLFERAWYGMHEVGEKAARRFAENCERIASDGTVAKASAAKQEVAHG